MASERGDSSSSQDVTPVPAVALMQSQNEVLLPSNNCPNCKLLSRHLKISREWNNFFRLKLDQRDMLLHVAADYKRQKQRCLQLQMSLDQQSRECGEMREQLTNLLLEMNPLKERVQIAEEAVKEERLHREKAESNEYNLRFLVEQQAHKIKACEKLKPNLTEILEKRLILLRSEVKRLKEDISQKSRVEWELKQQVSLAHSKHQRTLKKTRWGLSLAHKYGSRLLSQGQLLNESPQEWVRLKSVHEEVERVLHKHYLALCQHVQVRPLKENWLDDFDVECEEDEVGGEDSGGKQLEKIILGNNVDIASEGEEEICDKKTKGDGNHQYYNMSDSISKSVEKVSLEPRAIIRDEMPCSRTPKREDLPEVVTTSTLFTPAENSHNIVDGAAPHVADSCGSKDEKALTKSTSILDTSLEDNESDPLPNTDGSKDEKPVSISTSVLDTSVEDNESNPLPNTGGSKDRKVITKSIPILDTSAEDNESNPLPNTGGSMDRKVVTKSISILDTSVEDNESNPLPSTCGSRDRKVITKSISILDTSVEDNESNPLPGTCSNKDEKAITKSTSILDTSVKDNESDPLPNTCGSKDRKVIKKLISILDTSVEDNESDSIPSTCGSKDKKGLTKLTSILDTNVEDSESDPLPNRGGSKNKKVLTKLTSAEGSATDSILKCHDSVAETTFDPSNTGMDTINHIKPTSTEDIATKDLKSNPSKSAGETGHHTVDRVTVMYTQESAKIRSILDAGTEDSDEEILPRPQDSNADSAFPSSETKITNGDTGEPAPSVTSYHLDEELRAILQKMRPHEKLEDMDSLSPHSSEGQSHVKTGVHDPYVTQTLLAPLSESEEEEQEMKIYNAEDEIGDEISIPPRIFTTQMSEGFSVASSYRDNILQDDLDLSTDTLDPDDEKEQEKVLRKRVSAFSFPSTQSFSCDVEDSVPPPSSMQSPGLDSEGAEEDDFSKRFQKQCQHQLQQPVDKGIKNNGPGTDTPKTQNKESHRELRVMLAVDNSGVPDRRGPVDANAKEMYNEEDEEGGSENEGERKVLKGVWTKTAEPRKKQKTGVVKGKHKTIVKESTIETPEKSFENVDEETVGKEGRADIEKERIAEAKTQRAFLTVEQKHSTDKEERNTDGKGRITEPKKERISGARKGKSIYAKEEQHSEAAEGKSADGIERIITVVSENVEAIIEKEATDNVGKIPFDGQKRVLDAVEDILIEEEERTVAVVEKDTKMMKGRTTEKAEETLICEEERITDAVKERTTVAVLKPTWAEKEENPGSMRERGLYARQESLTDIVVKRKYESVAKRTTENLEKITTETVEHKTTPSARHIPVDVQQRPTNVLREKNRDPVDERTSERKTGYGVEEKVIKRSTNFTLENKYTHGESNTEYNEDRTTHAMEEIHTGEEGYIEAAEGETCDTLEEKARDTVRKEYTESLERRTADACEGVGNKYFAAVEEKTSEAATKRNTNAVEERDSKASGEKNQVEEDRSTQIIEKRDAEAAEEENTDEEEENARTEEESNVSSEEANAQSSKRRMRKVFNVTQQKEEKEEGGNIQGEISWKRRLRRQEKFEWESEEATRPEERGKKLRGCGVRKMLEKVELEDKRKGKKQEINKVKEVKHMEKEKKMNPEEKITGKKKESEKKQEEKVTEEESEEEMEGKIIKPRGIRKEEGRKGKRQKNEGKAQEKEGRIEIGEIKRTQEENVMKGVEEAVNDGMEEREKHGEEIEQNEEDTLKEIKESRRKEKKARRKEGKEKEKIKDDGNEKKKQEEQKRMGEKRKSTQKEKNQELKKRKAEDGRLCTLEAEEEGKSALNLKEGEKRNVEEEENHMSIFKGESGRETQGFILFKGGNFLGANKGQEKIVFSWSLKSTERKKIKQTNFIKWGKLKRVIPDPLGSLRHSVYTMECRIHPSEEQLTNRECEKTEQAGAASQETHEGRVMHCNDRNIEKKDLQKTNTSVVKRVSRGLVNESREDQINKENENKHPKENSVRNEKASKIGNRRKRNSRTSSNEEMSLCSSRELQNRKRPQQLITQQRSSTVSHSSHETSHISGVRQLKAKASKLKLFGLDSSNSSEMEEEKTVVKKSRKSKEKRHQEVQSSAHNRGIHCRLPLSLGSTVSENKKSREQVQISRTRELSTSRDCSRATSQMKNEFGEKSITEKMSPEQSCWSQENNSDVSSDIPRHPFTRRCKALLIESDSDDDQDDNSSSRIFQRKRKRKRKARMNDRIVNEESDSSSDSDQSSSGKKRPLAHHIFVKPLSANARTQTEMQRKVNKKRVIPQIDHKAVTTKEALLSSQSFTQNLRRLGYGHPTSKERGRTVREDCPAEETPSTPSNTIKRKQSVLLSETPIQSCRRQKRSSAPFSQAYMEHKVDSSDISNATYEPAGMEGREEDTLMLPNVENDSAMLPDKEKDAQPKSENVTHELSNSSDQDQNSSLVQSESDIENGLVIEESHDNCTETNTSNLSSPSTPVTSFKTQEGLGQRVPHLGPVVLIDRPKLQPKPAPVSAPAPKFTVRAGPEFIDRLFSKLNQQTGVCSEVNESSEKSSLEPAQDTHFKQSQKNANSQTEETNSHLTHNLRGANYQGQCPSFLPNFYGTLGPAAANDSSAPPRHGPNYSLAQTEPSTSLLLQPTCSQISSTSEQPKANLTSHTHVDSHLMSGCPLPTPGCTHLTHDLPQLTPTQHCATPLRASPAPGQAHSIPGHPHHTPVQPLPASSHPHSTPGHSHVVPGQPHSTLGHPHSTPGHHPIPGEPSECLVPVPLLQQVPWLPDITMHHGKRLAPIPIEQMKETLEEVVASKIQSRWWKLGLNKICVSITNATLPFFLRLVLETILRSDPLEPLQHYNGLPPRLFRLFQVVCVVEQRLTPQHPNGLRRALLRAIQAIVTQPDSRIRPHSLACLAAWYVASTSIDSHHEAAQEWGRGRAFLVDLLFHHPGTAHLSILTAARTCRRLFLKHVKYRELSGLEQVLMWLAHYGAWVGQPEVRSDLTKWLAQHLDSKKPPQNPSTVTKNLVTMLEPEMNKDTQWGAVVGLVVLVRWQGRLWAQKHLLPALSAAATKITTNVSQEDPGRGDLMLHEDMKNKISHLFDNLGQALPHGPVESQAGDVVKKMESAVNTLLSCHQ